MCLSLREGLSPGLSVVLSVSDRRFKFLARTLAWEAWASLTAVWFGAGLQPLWVPLTSSKNMANDSS